MIPERWKTKEMRPVIAQEYWLESCQATAQGKDSKADPRYSLRRANKAGSAGRSMQRELAGKVPEESYIERELQRPAKGFPIAFFIDCAKAFLLISSLLLSLKIGSSYSLPNKLIWQSQNLARFTLLPCLSSAKESICISSKAGSPYLWVEWHVWKSQFTPIVLGQILILSSFILKRVSG